MNNKVAIFALGAKAEVGFDDAENLSRQVAASLEKKGVQTYNTGFVVSDFKSAEKVAQLLQSEDTDAILVCVATWSDDSYVLQFLREINKPIILHSFPHMESGSLCGVMQIASVMNDIGFKNFKTVYAAPGSDESVQGVIEALNSFEDAGEKAADGKAFYIGSIGGRCAGMTEIAFDEFALFEKSGAIVVNISETELIETAQTVKDSDAEAVLSDIQSRGYHIDSSSDDMKLSVKYYLAMKELIKKYGLSGLAIKCYTAFMGKICLGYSLLSDEGYACSCEGDVNSAVMMKILMDVTGECVNNTDILNPLPDDNAIIFAHCGSSGFSIAPNADEVHLAPARIVDVGVCSLFRPKLGTVTAADLVGHGDNLRMSVMTGAAIEKEYLFPGNQACIRFERNVIDICKDVIDKACGHHWMVGYGDVRKELKEYCEKHDIVFQDIT
ncbi:MAG: hypothetical protein Q4E54_07970 [Lachnospiraceae bacterium]|nr:hypothetical protein [Lachnospiraceae bacterium]